MPRKSNKELYEEVAATITTAMDKGVVPWRKPWTDHHNPVTKTRYSGINPMLLGLTAMVKGYTDHRWVTYKGAKTLGGEVRKGERGTMIVFWKFLKVKADGEEKTIPMLRHYSVFSVEQCDGLELPPLGNGESLNPITAAEEIVAAFTDAPPIIGGGGRAWYRPSTDEIGMPDRASFHSAEDYYGTLFHEMVHSTGHKSRLNREGAFGEGLEGYSREELVAEMGAAMLRGRAGILTDDSTEQSASYIAGWKSRIAEDPGILVWAAGRAQKAADYIAEPVREEEPVTA